MKSEIFSEFLAGPTLNSARENSNDYRLGSLGTLKTTEIRQKPVETAEEAAPKQATWDNSKI